MVYWAEYSICILSVRNKRIRYVMECSVVISDVDELKTRLIVEWAHFDQLIVDAAASSSKHFCNCLRFQRPAPPTVTRVKSMCLLCVGWSWEIAVDTVVTRPGRRRPWTWWRRADEWEIGRRGRRRRWVRQRAADQPDTNDLIHRQTHACTRLASWTLVSWRQEDSSHTLLSADRVSTEPWQRSIPHSLPVSDQSICFGKSACVP